MVETNHTWVICAYKESAYLEACIQSVLGQSMASKMLMCTSTPNSSIENMASKYDIELRVNPVSAGIASDWNFALAQAETRYATIAHQDDIYMPDYLSTLYPLLEQSNKPLIGFTNYGELRNDQMVTDSVTLKVKRKFTKKAAKQSHLSTTGDKRDLIKMGNMICCPSVTYCLDNLTQPLFANTFKSNLDWETWEVLSRAEGDFVFCSPILMCHRVHEGSETSNAIANNTRTVEDLAMLEKFWPKATAKAINKVYSLGQISNKN